MYKLEVLSLDPAKMPDPNLEGAAMYHLASPTYLAPGGPTPKTFDEFETAIKNQAQSCILSSTNDVNFHTSKDKCLTSASSQTLGEIIEKLGAVSSASLSSELLNALQHWNSLLKKIQKIDQQVSKTESIKKVCPRSTPVVPSNASTKLAASARAAPAQAAPALAPSPAPAPAPSTALSTTSDTGDMVIELPDKVGDATRAVVSTALEVAKQCNVKLEQFVHSSAQLPLESDAGALYALIKRSSARRAEAAGSLVVRLIWKHTSDVALVLKTAPAEFGRRGGEAAVLAQFVALAPPGSNSAVLDLARKAAGGDQEALRRLAGTLPHS